MYNHRFIDEINQVLHNRGINVDDRLHVITKALRKEEGADPEVVEILNRTSYDVADTFQRVYMLLGSEKFHRNLDQFYTPITIGAFLASICHPGKQAIDPACGTGDLIVEYESEYIDLWDISPTVTELATFNFGIRDRKALSIRTHDSIRLHDDSNDSYDYCFLNPPFGSKTILTDTSVLQHYKMGRDRKKQELGILFIERSMNLLRENGILFAIVPNGYLGNQQLKYFREYILNEHRLLGVLELPSNTFSRSGTGVSTSILMIQKTKTPPEDYPVFIRVISKIGYELHKKNTPMAFTESGAIDSELPHIVDEIKTWATENKVPGLRTEIEDAPYDHVMKSELISRDYAFNVRRHYKRYKSLETKLQDCNRIKDLCINANFLFRKNNDSTYKYLDIGSVQKCMYDYEVYTGATLPSRALRIVKTNDIIVSKLRGKLTFTVIMEDDLIVSSGFIVLRASSYENMLRLFAMMFTEEFMIQHQSFQTGSIMESASDADILNFYVPANLETEKYEKVLEAMRTLKSALV